jgi:glutaredoxin 3
MSRVIVYTTEPCGFCRAAKSLLGKRGVAFEEVNLAKNAHGRAELVAETGMMTFPQIVIDERIIGGFQELMRLDRTGALAELAAVRPAA